MSYSLLTGRPLHFGSVVPLGPELKLLTDDAAPQYVLIIELLPDDRDIYSQPEGQITDDKSLIQFLWVIPIFCSEAEFIAREGDEEFINLFLS